jgi:hypothetical protein
VSAALARSRLSPKELELLPYLRKELSWAVQRRRAREQQCNGGALDNRGAGSSALGVSGLEHVRFVGDDDLEVAGREAPRVHKTLEAEERCV